MENSMLKFRPFRKTAVQLMRPYIQNENMNAVDIPKGIIPCEGGMIAIDPANPLDQWYITPEFVKKNYEPVEES